MKVFYFWSATYLSRTRMLAAQGTLELKGLIRTKEQFDMAFKMILNAQPPGERDEFTLASLNILSMTEEDDDPTT